METGKVVWGYVEALCRHGGIGLLSVLNRVGCLSNVRKLSGVYGKVV